MFGFQCSVLKKKRMSILSDMEFQIPKRYFHEQHYEENVKLISKFFLTGTKACLCGTGFVD